MFQMASLYLNYGDFSVLNGVLQVNNYISLLKVKMFNGSYILINERVGVVFFGGWICQYGGSCCNLSSFCM